MRILGISCYYHDSAACLLVDGVVVAAAQEERFSRIKADARFPRQSLRYCLDQAGIAAGDTIDAVAYYDKPILKFHRLIETHLAIAPRGAARFAQAMPSWLTKKLWIEPDIHSELAKLGIRTRAVYFCEHHEAHAASAFFPSPFADAAVLTLDGVGEWATASLGLGRGKDLQLLETLNFPHSLGLLYAAFTAYAGFKVNSGEYKLMGLAPYGRPVYCDQIRGLMDLKQDGSFALDMKYFGYLAGQQMWTPAFAHLFDGPPRQPEAPLQQRDLDLARSIQVVTEEVVLAMAAHAKSLTGQRNLCLAGGVALNCVANGRLLRAGLFDNLWIQPAAGDAGGALGAAYATWHTVLGQSRHADGQHDAMQGCYLGPEFADADIAAWLDRHGFPYTRLSPQTWADQVAELIEKQQVVGLFMGRMEFGPRALGNRSIVGDPRSPAMQSVMNLKIKFRESFRPFAPSVLEEHAAAYFDLDRPSPYMLLVADVLEQRRTPMQPIETYVDLQEIANAPRSDVPAITHVDYSARVQTVSKETNPRYHELISAFFARTGCPMLVNTSFNVRGEPIVATPEQAYRCLMRTQMDALVLGNLLVRRDEQPRFLQEDFLQGPAALD